MLCIKTLDFDNTRLIQIGVVGLNLRRKQLILFAHWGCLMSTCLRILLIIAASILMGCTTTQPLPIAARSGDTITLALGSQVGMKTVNTTVTFTPDSTGIPISLTPKSIFNLYPDKRSKAYQDVALSLVVQAQMHEQWLTAMAIDLPNNLPVGFGTIKVSTTVPQVNGQNAKLEDVDYRLEILPGAGTPHSLMNQMASGYLYPGNLSTLQQVPYQAYIIPPYQTCHKPTNYAVIELRFRLSYVIEPYRDVEWFTVVADDLTAYTKNKSPQLIWSAKGDELVVIFMSTDGVLKCYEPRFSLVPTDSSFNDYGPPVLLSVTYYDVSGAVISGSAASEYQVVVQ